MLKELLPALPRIAEEGNYAVSVSRKQLSELIETQTELASDFVQPTLQIVEVYFQKMGWLDPFELDAGNWKFCSFPASLAARSWLTVMADPDGAWHPAGWWWHGHGTWGHGIRITCWRKVRKGSKRCSGDST